MNPRERLNHATFDSLESMVEAYASQAVETARSEHRLQLDYSGATIDRLESILATITVPLAEDQEYLTRLWGSYLGEVLWLEFGGEWIMSVYPGGELSIPTLEVQGSRLYPLLKVFRRLTLGESENLATFYRMVRERLGAPKKSQ